MPQPTSCVDFLRLQPSKLLKSCLLLFKERRGLVSSKVKHLLFSMGEVLFEVCFSKNNTSKSRTETLTMEEVGPLLPISRSMNNLSFLTLP